MWESEDLEALESICIEAFRFFAISVFSMFAAILHWFMRFNSWFHVLSFVRFFVFRYVFKVSETSCLSIFEKVGSDNDEIPLMKPPEYCRPIVEITCWDLLRNCWSYLLESVVEIIYWGQLLRLPAEVCCWSYLLKWNTEMSAEF